MAYTQRSEAWCTLVWQYLYGNMENKFVFNVLAFQNCVSCCHGLCDSQTDQISGELVAELELSLAAADISWH